MASDPKEGVYGKYRIAKADGSAVDPDATYFVLRLDTDEDARAVMLLYAERVGGELQDHIEACVREIERPQCGCRTGIECTHEPMFDPVWRHGDA